MASRVAVEMNSLGDEPGDAPLSQQRVCVVHNAALMEKDSALDTGGWALFMQFV